MIEKGDGVNHQYHCGGECLSSAFALLGSGREQKWIGCYENRIPLTA